MNNKYKIAPLADNNEVINDISRLEAQLKQKAGMEIVLIAYTNSENQ